MPTRVLLVADTNDNSFAALDWALSHLSQQGVDESSGGGLGLSGFELHLVCASHDKHAASHANAGGAPGVGLQQSSSLQSPTNYGRINTHTHMMMMEPEAKTSRTLEAEAALLNRLQHLATEKFWVPPAQVVQYILPASHGVAGAADVIVQYATQMQAELIVLADERGMGGVKRALMSLIHAGTLADAVLTKAPCPVLIVREHQRMSVLHQHQAHAAAEERRAQAAAAHAAKLAARHQAHAASGLHVPHIFGGTASLHRDDTTAAAATVPAPHEHASTTIAGGSTAADGGMSAPVHPATNAEAAEAVTAALASTVAHAPPPSTHDASLLNHGTVSAAGASPTAASTTGSEGGATVSAIDAAYASMIDAASELVHPNAATPAVAVGSTSNPSSLAAARGGAWEDGKLVHLDNDSAAQALSMEGPAERASALQAGVLGHDEGDAARHTRAAHAAAGSGLGAPGQVPSAVLAAASVASDENDTPLHARGEMYGDHGLSPVFGQGVDGGLNVCVATDDSPQAQHALMWAIQKLLSPTSSLCIITMPLPAPAEATSSTVAMLPAVLAKEVNPGSDEGKADGVHYVPAYLQWAQQAAEAKGVPRERITTMVHRPGKGARSIGHSIVDYAEEGSSTDVVVVGSRGLGSLKSRVLDHTGLGSVASWLAHHLRVPLVVVKSAVEITDGMALLKNPMQPPMAVAAPATISPTTSLRSAGPSAEASTPTTATVAAAAPPAVAPATSARTDTAPVTKAAAAPAAVAPAEPVFSKGLNAETPTAIADPAAVPPTEPLSTAGPTTNADDPVAATAAAAGAGIAAGTVLAAGVHRDDAMNSRATLNLEAVTAPPNTVSVEGVTLTRDGEVVHVTGVVAQAPPELLPATGIALGPDGELVATTGVVLVPHAAPIIHTGGEVVPGAAEAIAAVEAVTAGTYNVSGASNPAPAAAAIPAAVAAMPVGVASSTVPAANIVNTIPAEGVMTTRGGEVVPITGLVAQAPQEVVPATGVARGPDGELVPITGVVVVPHAAPAKPSGGDIVPGAEDAAAAAAAVASSTVDVAPGVIPTRLPRSVSGAGGPGRSRFAPAGQPVNTVPFEGVTTTRDGEVVPVVGVMAQAPPEVVPATGVALGPGGEVVPTTGVVVVPHSAPAVHSGGDVVPGAADATAAAAAVAAGAGATSALQHVAPAPQPTFVSVQPPASLPARSEPAGIKQLPVFASTTVPLPTSQPPFDSSHYIFRVLPHMEGSTASPAVDPTATPPSSYQAAASAANTMVAAQPAAASMAKPLSPVVSSEYAVPLTATSLASAPVAHALARSLGMDPDSVEGSGPSLPTAMPEERMMLAGGVEVPVLGGGTLNNNGSPSRTNNTTLRSSSGLLRSASGGSPRAAAGAPGGGLSRTASGSLPSAAAIAAAGSGSGTGIGSTAQPQNLSPLGGLARTGSGMSSTVTGVSPPTSALASSGADLDTRDGKLLMGTSGTPAIMRHGVVMTDSSADTTGR